MKKIAHRMDQLVIRYGRLSSSLMVVVALSGCLAATATSISQSFNDAIAPKVTFLVPAKNSEAGALKSILVVSDDQRVSQHVAVDFESRMSRLRIAEKPFFTKVKLGPKFNGMPADSQLAELAKIHGVDGVYVISGGSSDAKSTARSEDRFSCAVETKLFERCPKGGERNSKVGCTTTVGYSAVRLRVFRAVDGRFVYADTVYGQSSYDQCSDQNKPSADTNQLMNLATSETSANAMRIVAPSYEVGPLDIMGADAPIPAAQKGSFEAAVEFAKAKRSDEACRRFDELYMDIKDSAALTFNVAFCHELSGDMLRANQGYKRASEIVNRPESQIDRRLAITEKAMLENPMAFVPAMSGPTLTALANQGGLAGSKRVALVIGNAKYQKSALVNPINDARLVSDRLKRIGFDVVTMENLDSSRFESGIRDFANRAKGADVALFYYAGHALQADGENYLMPVNNSSMRTLEDVRNGGSVQLASVLAMLDVSAPVVKIVIVDACRDSPLPSLTRSLSGGGLAPITKAPRGGLIAFATAPGRTADDGTGKNSTFSKHFAAQIGVPGQTIEQIFKRVREAVKTETKNRQEPIETSNLVGDVLLVQATTK